MNNDLLRDDDLILSEENFNAGNNACDDSLAFAFNDSFYNHNNHLNSAELSFRKKDFKIKEKKQNGDLCTLTENIILKMFGNNLRMRIFAAIVKQAIKDSFLKIPEKIKKLNLTKEEIWHNKYCKKISKIKFDAEYFLDYMLKDWCDILNINYKWLKNLIEIDVKIAA